MSARLARQRQRASRETLAFLAEACEGNLLAARQEIEKLALLLPEGELPHDAVESAVADVARYDVFELSEAWLAGDAARTVRIVRALEAEGEAPTLAIWQLSEDMHALAVVAALVRTGTPPTWPCATRACGASANAPSSARCSVSRPPRFRRS
jgi:DNA polymerase-3 subunit delta